MVAERVLDVMGVRVRLTLEGSAADALVPAVERTWERCLVAEHASVTDTVEARRVRVVLDEDEGLVAEARSAGAVAGATELVVLDELTTRLVREGLEAKVGDRWLLHACALGDPSTGATAVLVAPSGTGKTTASTTLARTLGYVTDETAVVERDGSMTPFPKPLSFLVDGTRPKKQVSPGELGMLPSPPKPWLARVALLHRDPEVTGVRVEPVPTVEALAFLAEQTSSLHLLERPLSTVASLLHARGGLQRLVYSESAELAPVLAGWLAEATPLVDDAAGEPPAAATAGPEVGTEEPTLAPGHLRRTVVRDEYLEDGAMAVLVNGRVLALSAMATLLLLAVQDAGPEGLATRDLEEFLTREVGVPEGMEVSEALAPLLDDLVSNGLLLRG